MFRGGRPCLVAIELVSNYILVEKFTEDRKATTWQKEIQGRLEGFNVEVGQVVSDLCGAIRSCTKALEAEHIPELFHAQREISKATSASLASQQRASEKELSKANETVKKIEDEPRRMTKKARERKKWEIKKALEIQGKLKIDCEQKTARREEVKSAVKEMGKIHHPIDLKTGALQTAAGMGARFNEQFALIEKRSSEAKLSDSSTARLEKAKRAFDAIVCYLIFYFSFYKAFVDDLELSLKQDRFFNDVIFPLAYLKMIWRRLPTKDKEELYPLLKTLESSSRDGPWPEPLKEKWRKKGAWFKTG
jgi:hypothetical protein